MGLFDFLFGSDDSLDESLNKNWRETGTTIPASQATGRTPMIGIAARTTTTMACSASIVTKKTTFRVRTTAVCIHCWHEVTK